jgi:hypothetical protein
MASSHSERGSSENDAAIINIFNSGRRRNNSGRKSGLQIPSSDSKSIPLQNSSSKKIEWRRALDNPLQVTKNQHCRNNNKPLTPSLRSWNALPVPRSNIKIDNNCQRTDACCIVGERKLIDTNVGSRNAKRSTSGTVHEHNPGILARHEKFPQFRSFPVNLSSRSSNSSIGVSIPLSSQKRCSARPKITNTSQNESKYSVHDDVPRRVRFDENRNVTIPSVLSYVSIKEYRKHMWWSTKDRIRSMKQRDVELQNILKQNTTNPQSTGGNEGVLLPVVQPQRHRVNSTTSSASATTGASSVGNDATLEMTLSEYCQAIVTLYIHCHNQCMKAPPSCSHNNKPTKRSRTISRSMKAAINIIVSSNYRGLERIVCKILHAVQDESHRATVILMPTMRAPFSPSIKLPSRHAENDTDNNVDEHNLSNATILAEDLAIEVMSTTSESQHGSDNVTLESSQVHNVTWNRKSTDVTANSLPIDTTASIPMSSSISPSVFIRKQLLEYQTQLQHCSCINTAVDSCTSTTVCKNSPHGRDENDPNDLVSLNVVQEQAKVQQSVLLSNYYQSFPARSISILWAQFIAMGDHHTSKSSS